jgi:hypothetical protein
VSEEEAGTATQAPEETAPGVPSNDVYSRVGDAIKLAAHDGVRRGLTPQDIIREIAERYHVHLNVGELRLLLASRRETASKKEG